MYYSVITAGLCGIKGYPVNAEIDVAEGFPKLELVGLAHSSVKESVERVKTTLKNTGFTFPYKRVTINLAPAQIRKYGSHYDLPIAVGILAASGQTELGDLPDIMMIGELSLNGDVVGVRGALAMAEAAREQKIKKIILPMQNWREVCFYDDIEIIPVRRFKEVITYLQTGELSEEAEQLRQRIKNHVMAGSETDIYQILEEEDKETGAKATDFADIKGQNVAKRAMTAAMPLTKVTPYSAQSFPIPAATSLP